MIDVIVGCVTMNPSGKENSQTENTPTHTQWSIADFDIGGKLGRGRFGNVYVVRERKSGLILALKVVYKGQIVESRMEFQIRREIEIQSNLRHVNILRLYGYFHDDERIYFLLEYAPGGDVYKHLRDAVRFPEERAARYISQVAAALTHMHKKHVIHRDIKPENLLIGVDKQIRMSDFGWSVHTCVDAPNRKRATICGTVDYLPPEMIDRAGHTFSADLWCLGVLAYEFLIGRAPFEASDTPMTQDRIRRVDYTFPDHVPISVEAKDLIRRLLKREPSSRLTLREVHAHPWIRKHTRGSATNETKGSSFRSRVLPTPATQR